MSKTESQTQRRLWRVLGPVALILTGFGWLAIGLVLGGRTVCRLQPENTTIQYATVSTGQGANGTYAAMPLRSPTRSGAPILNPATGHSYGVISAPTWNAGQEMAARMGGRLVTIDDAEEQAWLESTFGGEALWIGLTDVDQEGRWEWTDGQRPSYTNWAIDEPNNMDPQGEHFAVMNWAQPGGWNDVNPDSAVGNGVVAGIVEWEPRVAHLTRPTELAPPAPARPPTESDGRP
ncbi:hypothetical protein HN371_04525 [Candidatus Poribacteria bacterium]|nr:hypothetical protein [Candidatus Poribacteria bacterium]MBT5533880.1 hypothetical protein [Candidatus Poribacteria bacterium]MBT5712537.1 hypothetical protein [Candidatus Poribacteria bacterium]MBT7096191.1 hypothetical protein [Candidatus Poribacteria bacterium]MBT7805349.1 hypothetical protein [Candidatus Poribacteria bacterium]